MVRRGWRGGLRVGRVINSPAPCPPLPTYVWLETYARLRDEEGGAPDHTTTQRQLHNYPGNEIMNSFFQKVQIMSHKLKKGVKH